MIIIFLSIMSIETFCRKQIVSFEQAVIYSFHFVGRTKQNFLNEVRVPSLFLFTHSFFILYPPTVPKSVSAALSPLDLFDAAHAASVFRRPPASTFSGGCPPQNHYLSSLP